MWISILKAAVIDFAIQWSCWALAAPLKTEKFYDLAGTGAFCLLACQSLRWGKTFFTRQKIVTGLVIAWSVRAKIAWKRVRYGLVSNAVFALQAALGLFLFSRVLKSGGDRRFNGIREKPAIFWFYWTMQGVWVIITMLPVLMLNANNEDSPITTQDYIGWALWGVGFFLEVAADYQKSVFKSKPNNADKFIKHGLWSICRHPNYLGEILMWTGVYVTSSSVLSGYEHISIISPTILAFLLIYVSGVPPLEEYALKKWGGNPDYQTYLRNTAKIIPYIW